MRKRSSDESGMGQGVWNVSGRRVGRQEQIWRVQLSQRQQPAGAKGAKPIGQIVLGTVSQSKPSSN